MSKISIIGAGFVGSTSAYALMLKEVADEIAISQAQVSRLEKGALQSMRKYV